MNLDDGFSLSGEENFLGGRFGRTEKFCKFAKSGWVLCNFEAGG